MRKCVLWAPDQTYKVYDRVKRRCQIDVIESRMWKTCPLRFDVVDGMSVNMPLMSLQGLVLDLRAVKRMILFRNLGNYSYF